MASGKVHDRFNLLIGFWLFIALVIKMPNWVTPLSFLGGFLFSTFIFSPDTDIMPKKRTGPLRFILFPYSILFKHRGSSHALLWGTLGRLFYLFILILLIVSVFHRMGDLPYSATHLIDHTWLFLQNFDYSLMPYQILVWVVIGMFLADLCHLLLDLLIR